MLLERCVVSVDPDFDEVFEIMDGNKESYLFKVLIYVKCYLSLPSPPLALHNLWTAPNHLDDKTHSAGIF